MRRDLAISQAKNECLRLSVGKLRWIDLDHFHLVECFLYDLTAMEIYATRAEKSLRAHNTVTPALTEAEETSSGHAKVGDPSGPLAGPYTEPVPTKKSKRDV